MSATKKEVYVDDAKTLCKGVFLRGIIISMNSRQDLSSKCKWQKICDQMITSVILTYINTSFFDWIWFIIKYIVWVMLSV